jgi:hypothetical protein
VQTAAPTGWTKSTTHNDKALRVVSGAASSGGSVAFTTAFASQAVSGTNLGYSLTVPDLPSHNHTATSTVTDPGHVHSYSNFTGAGGNGYGAGTQTTATPNTGSSVTGITVATSIGSTGSGTAHTHTFTGTAINLAVQYVDVIIATKD